MQYMGKYLEIIKNRWQSSKNKFLFLNWVFLRIKKVFRIDFYDDCEKKTGKVDLIIPTVSKDYVLLEKYLESLKNLCQEINKIYVVSGHNKEILSFCARHNLIFIDENSVLGYGKETIKYIVSGVDRSGWIFQQLLKLSGEKFIDMEKYIIVDSDTILINKHSFLNGNKFVFFENEEWHEPYFRSFEKMFGYKAKNRLSFTSHMMIFNVENLKKMKNELEIKHKMSWDKIYLSNIDEREMSCVSDYDTYANWVFYHFPEKVIRKPLYNRSISRTELSNLENLKEKYKNKYKSISFHSYIKH